MYTTGIKLLFISSLCSSLLFSQHLRPQYGERKISPFGGISTSWYKTGWFGEINLGTRLMGAVSAQAQLKAGINYNMSGGYFVKDAWGLRARVDFHTFPMTPGINGSTAMSGNAIALSGEGLLDLVALLNKSSFNRYRIILHGGAGLTSYANNDFKAYRDEIGQPLNDPAINGNDDMGHILLGITPQWHLGGRWSLQADVSTFLLIKQDFTFDSHNGVRHDGLGNVSALSVGLTFRP